MVYAIIDAMSDIEELITVAYGESPDELVRWFVDEVRDTADMYLSQSEDFEQMEKACQNLEILCEEDCGTAISDVDGITVEIAGVSVSVLGAFDNYDEMKESLLSIISEKPKFKKIVVPDNSQEDEKIIDNLNSELIRHGI